MIFFKLYNSSYIKNKLNEFEKINKNNLLISNFFSFFLKTFSLFLRIKHKIRVNYIYIYKV